MSFLPYSSLKSENIGAIHGFVFLNTLDLLLHLTIAIAKSIISLILPYS